ncbi:GTP cyclohydrolase II [Streptomyces sp. S1D4-11]
MRESRNATASSDSSNPTGLSVATVRTRVTVPFHFGDGYAVTADLVTFHHLADGQEHVAVILGEPAAGRPPLVRLHSECLTGDVFGSARCDCGPQLREAAEHIADRGGVLLYLRQAGRGIGLYNKLDAYARQDQGLDTHEANAVLGLPEDARDYTAAAQMLAALGIFELDLLSNNPDKAAQLRTLGLTVAHHVPTGVFTTARNIRYLRTEAVRTRHTLPLTELTAG